MTWRRFQRRRTRGTAGLALVEVLVTVAIIVMIGGLAFATMGNRDPALARTEAAKIALVLQRARMESAELGAAVEIRWDARNQTLVAGTATHTMRAGVEGPSNPIEILIQPTGQSDGLSLPVSAGAHRVTVTLDWLTGRVRQSS